MPMMGLTWYLIGLVAGGAVLLLFSLARKQRLPWIYIAGMSLGIFLILFCMAWSVASTLEGVPRAASLGIVCFGLPGIVLLVVSGRKAVSVSGDES